MIGWVPVFELDFKVTHNEFGGDGAGVSVYVCAYLMASWLTLR